MLDGFLIFYCFPGFGLDNVIFFPPLALTFYSLDLLLLGDEVGEGAFAAEEVAGLLAGCAGDRIAGWEEAEVAATKWEEGIAGETRAGGAPLALECIAFV